MQRFRLALLVALGLLVQGCLSPAPDRGPEGSADADPGELVRRFSAEEVASLLRREGYGSVELLEDGNVRFKADGMTYVVYLYDDGDLQLYFALTGIHVTPEVMNEWNRTKRLSRAYLDTDQDPVLEADLLSDAGLSARMVARWVQVFVQGSGLFHAFLMENGSLEPMPADASPAAI